MPHATSRLLGALVVTLAAAAAGCAADNAPTDQQRAYERYVRDLSSRSPDKAGAAWTALFHAEMDAFPTLLEHFGDRKLASSAVSGARMGQITVGYACYEIVRMNIEGAWPKSIRDFHLLTPENTRQWLAEHPGLTLAELQRAATREALARAEATVAADPTNGYAPHCVEFLRKRDAKLAR